MKGHKLEAALKARQAAYTPKSAGGQHQIMPGSRNAKKGYGGKRSAR